MEPFDSYTKMIFVVAALLSHHCGAIARYIETRGGWSRPACHP